MNMMNINFQTTILHIIHFKNAFIDPRHMFETTLLRLLFTNQVNEVYEVCEYS